ncbi:MAG: 2-oxoisovalerate dehydrogenase [Melioribacteraceae bacterium]
MKTEIIFIVQESLEGGYEARALGASIFTEAEGLEELKKNVKEAVACHFEESEMPKIIRLHYVKEEVIAA